jgi:peptide/nickel transport system ATP-binding protein
MSAPLLEVDNLALAFGSVPVVQGVSFTMAAGTALGLVGESGSGKSMTALSILRLVPPPGRITAGAIRLNGVDLASIAPDRLPAIRGRDVAMIFQEPMSALNPVMTVGDQIDEAILLHEDLPAAVRRARVIDLLARVGIPDPGGRADAYPHQFSGGMRQRVMIAMALACSPKLLIADEPTTALDVTIQAQVLDLMKRIRAETGTAILLISHDLGIIAEMCEQVIVLYAGRIVEAGAIRAIFHGARHPYTRGLLQSIPRLDDDRRRLFQIPGSVPMPGTITAGCAFYARCADRIDRCASDTPALRDIGGEHRAACWVHAP